jgi:hypothetical protein
MDMLYVPGLNKRNTWLYARAAVTAAWVARLFVVELEEGETP